MGHTDAQRNITAFWDAVADGYEAHGGNVDEVGSSAYRTWVDVLASVLPQTRSDVLDVAAGTGYVSLAAASLGHRVTAIDLAPAMLDELRRNASARGLDVDARLGDAMAPLPPRRQRRRGERPAVPHHRRPALRGRAAMIGARDEWVTAGRRRPGGGRPLHVRGS